MITLVIIIVFSYVQRYPSTSTFIPLIFIVLFWRVMLGIAGFIALAERKTFYAFGELITKNSLTSNEFHTWFYRLVGCWYQWNGGNYLKIARVGYAVNGRFPTIAFFPLYPMLCRALGSLISNQIVAGLLVSHIAFAVALYFLYDLITKDFDFQTAYTTILLILVFPTSFFFIASFTESLAFALLVIVVWAARREHWWVAGCAGALLALTRLPGVFSALIILVAYLRARGWRAVRYDALAALLPPVGLALFMLWQWQHFGEPLAFLWAQQAWGQRISMPSTTFATWLPTLTQDTAPIAVFQAVVYVVFIALTVLALWRLPLVYGLSTLLMLLPSYTSNLIHSLPRYVLLGSLTFVAVALLVRGRPWLYYGIIATCAPLLVLGTMLFVNSFWMG